MSTEKSESKTPPKKLEPPGKDDAPTEGTGNSDVAAASKEVQASDKSMEPSKDGKQPVEAQESHRETESSVEKVENNDDGDKDKESANNENNDENEVKKTDANEKTVLEECDSNVPVEKGDNDAVNEGDMENAKKRNSPSDASVPLRPVKRARTAYFIFMDEKRPEVQAQHVGEGVAAVARIMGQMWAAISAEEKEMYQKKAAEERERVAKELEEWKAAGGVEPELPKEKNDPSALIYPIARIRKICKLDPEVRGLSKEALLLVTKCAELATAKLGQECVKVAQLQNRRKLLPDDVAHVCNHREQFLFLKDDIRDLVKALPSSDPKNHLGKKGDAAKESAAAGTKPLTAYFAAGTSTK